MSFHPSGFIVLSWESLDFRDRVYNDTKVYKNPGGLGLRVTLTIT